MASFLLVVPEVPGFFAAAARLVMVVLARVGLGFVAAGREPVVVFCEAVRVPVVFLAVVTLFVEVVLGLPSFLPAVAPVNLSVDAAVGVAGLRRCFVPFFGPGFLATLLASQCLKGFETGEAVKRSATRLSSFTHCAVASMRV